MGTLSADESGLATEPPPQLQILESHDRATPTSDQPCSESRVPPDAADHTYSSATEDPAPVTLSETEAKPKGDAHLADVVMGLGLPTGEGISFTVGDLVWAKTKSLPWWPALVSDPSTAPDAVKKVHRRDVSVLVSCFGSGAFSWCEPAQLKPFVEEFHRMVRQSNSNSFIAAVECALDLVRQRLQSELTCRCISPEAKTAGELTWKLPVTNLQPSEFLDILYDVACDVTLANMLEVQALKSWVMAFGKGWRDGSPGYHPHREIMELVDKIDLDVPPGDLGDGNEEGDSECWITGSGVGQRTKTSEHNFHERQKKRSMAALIAGMDLDTVELSDGDEVKVEEKVKAVKPQKKLGNDKVMDADSGEVEANEDSGSGRRARKKSKYLSPPYTCLGAYNNSPDSPKSAEVKSTRKAAVASRALNSDVSALSNNSEALQKEEDTSTPDLSMESTSMNDILSEFLCTARNPLHLKWNRSAKMIKSFFIKYRSSMYSSGYDFLTYQKHHNESSDKIIGSMENVILDNSSEVGISAGKQKQKKDAASPEVETGLSPDTRSRSEQGKTEGKRKKDAASSEVETGLSPDTRSQSEQGKTGRKRKKDAASSEVETGLSPDTRSQSEQGKTGRKRKKDAASSEVETGLSPDTRSHSEQGKTEGKRKRKMRKDEANSTMPVNTDPLVINIPVESRYENKNIESKEGITEESLIPCSEQVSSLQPTEIENKIDEGKDSVNGQKTVESASNLSKCSQEGKSGKKRKKSKPTNTKSPQANLTRGIANGSEKNKSGHPKKDDEYCYSYPGALLLTFAPGVPLPSQNELISTFTKYGVVLESETELLKDTNCARIVFAKSTDAEKAFNCSDKTGVFAPPCVSYGLRYLPPIASAPHQIPPLPYIRESLERMISTLTTTSAKETGPSDAMKPDARENLVVDMEGLLKKVNTMLHGAPAGT